MKNKLRLATTLGRATACFMLGLQGLAPSQAAVTDIATAPLVTSSPQEVKPNLLLVLDDSGSMQFSYMPDDARFFDNVGNSSAGAPMYGYRSSQCNGVYYNPEIRYTPPVTSTGASYPNASYTAAWINGFVTASGTVNLSTNFRAYTAADNWFGNEGTPVDTAQPAYYYKYDGLQRTEAQRTYTDPGSTFYTECQSVIGTLPTSTFARVNVGATSGPGNTDERTNFANWYSYYRTRLLMMKTATGQAFKSIDNDYRVGYMGMNGNGTAPAFLNIATFEPAQKLEWYSALYGAVASGGTPLRDALSDAGRVYAGVLTSVHGVGVADPVQYSCQKNFTLLSTDGYWNGAAGVKLDGSAIGNQDIGEPRPFGDGGTSSDLYLSTLVVGNASGTATTLDRIDVAGQTITSGQMTSTNTNKAVTLATRIATAINSCTSAITGTCTVAGYSATRSGSTVTIRAPAGVGATNAVPLVTRAFGTGTVTAVASAFAGQTTNSGGTSDTLADVAEYYYKTDLRGEENNVQSSNDDPANWQHMTTFTLGLGARGAMVYSPTYYSDTIGDFAAVKEGSIASATVCTWQTAGSVCNWPTPSADSLYNIDDLWHAAVNGRGRYFSTRDPVTLAGSLEDALNTIASYRSASATAATSNPNVTQGDNYRFLTTFTSSEWTGQVERYLIDLTEGDQAGTANWQAKESLATNTSRNIFTYTTATTSRLKPFTWDSLSAAEKAYFSVPWISSSSTPVAPLWQFCASGEFCLSSATQTAASGAPLVQFLRGDRSNEGASFNLLKYFRQRTAVLGDIVSSRATYVRKPRYLYIDEGYSAYKAAQAERAGTVYVGANDGMLHAFDGDTGAERWAYIPSLVLPNLFKLADKRYPVSHQYYVDGSPIDADVKFSSDNTWHTILVGGLNRGGRGYYALDVTDPLNPKALWEFTHVNMGYSFGKPEIVKLKSGRWVVLVTSGYNNVDGVGQADANKGKGFLYVLDASTGELLNTIGTGEGTALTPSGLAQIRAWVENGVYNTTTLRVYGGDLLGNVWRFDVNGDLGGSAAQKLAVLLGPGGAAQPVTTKPELGKVKSLPVVFVGTGRSLGITDIYDASVQSIYAIKDKLTATTYTGIRADAKFIAQTLTAGRCGAGVTFCASGDAARLSSNRPVNFVTDNGWYIDLPAARERADTDMQLAYGVLAIATNSLVASACEVGGSSYANFINYATGGSLATTNGVVSVPRVDLSTGLSFSIVTDTGGTRRLVATQSKSDGTSESFQVDPGASVRLVDRTSWRELVEE